jgi:hypothetical protein
MANLFNMDLYRMFKAKSFKVCLLLSFLISLSRTPLMKLLDSLAKMVATEGEAPQTLVGPTANLSDIIASPLSSFALIPLLICVVLFFYADMENGYIKNIAGQMPKRGFSILSRFLVSIVHNGIFLIACVIGHLIGTLLFQKITADGAVMTGILCFILKWVLLQSLCAILLLAAATFRSKSLGMVLAILFAIGGMGLLYLAIDQGLNALFKGFGGISPYMPDELLSSVSIQEPRTLRAILSAAITTAIFLPLSIRVFDKRDVK